MRKKAPTRDSPEGHSRMGILRIIRTYLSVIRLLHRGLGVPRIIAAYLFFAFAVCSLLFTIRVPVTSDFLTPTGWAKAQSRAITSFMMVINIIVYGIIMSWRRSDPLRIAIRVALIGSALYLDVILIRITYVVARDITFF
jgi:hypothetical protein